MSEQKTYLADLDAHLERLRLRNKIRALEIIEFMGTQWVGHPKSTFDSTKPPVLGQPSVSYIAPRRNT